MDDFTVVGDNDDDFQAILDNLPGLSPVVPGKRGGGRKAINNIGADTVGIEMLKVLRTDHHVDISKAENLKGRRLWGVIDQPSFDRARQISMNVEEDELSYSQKGVLAISLDINDAKEIFVKWWKGTIVNGVLSFRHVFRKGEDYKLCKDTKGRYGLWKMDSTTGLPRTKNNGDYFSFPYSTLVNFEDYLNAIVEVTEVPVSFPEGEVTKLENLSEILANVNLNADVQNNNDSDESEVEEPEELEEEV
jgi:hypothetical protein